MIFFRPEQQLRRDLSHLSDAARSHFQLLTECCLYGIDNDNVRSQLFRGCKNFLNRHFGIDVKIMRSHVQPLPAHFDLLRRFFTGCVKHERRLG